MKKIVLFLFFTVSVYSQVGIGTTTPAGALDVVSTSNGILIPRIALTAKNVAAPVVNPQGGALVVGTLIWNTATAGVVPNNVSPGYYYWDGTYWVKTDNVTRSGVYNATSTLVEPNASIPGTLGAMTSAGTNSTAGTFDVSTITRTINVTGFTGNIGNIVCTVNFGHTWASDADVYLQSPTGQIIELTTDNGGTNPTTFSVTFSDAGATNITSWAGGNVTGTYRPEGTLTTDVLVPNITTMAGFNGNSPNGTWTLHLRDDLSGDNFSFVNFSLSIATIGTANYRLVGETSIVYKSGTNIITNAMYSANCNDDQGFITALTRSTSSAGAIGTTIATLPGTVVSYASDSPKQGSGNYWATTYNQSVSNGLTDGTIYYFQLWSKANVQSPTTSNEIYSLLPIIIPQ